MPYLKKDGTPRRIPKHYWGVWSKVNEKVKPKAKKSTVEGVKKMRDNFRKKTKLRVKARIRNRKNREELALENAINNGTLDELHELMQEVKESGLPSTKAVYDKEGNLIPTSKRLLADFDSDLAEQILERMRTGDTVQMIAKDGLITLGRFRKWYRNVPTFKRDADLADIERTEVFHDKLVELTQLVKTGDIGTREASFIADQYKWLMERLNPKFMQKSNKTDLNVQVNDDGKVQFQILLAPGGAVANDS